MTQQEALETIVKALDSKRAEDIQVLHVEDLTILGDYFIIANGTSTTHTRTLADEVEYQMTQKGREPGHREGRGNGSNWVVLDYADIIVHIFYKETRDFYQLERLWADGEQVDISQWIKTENGACWSRQKGCVFYGRDRKKMGAGDRIVFDFKGSAEFDTGV